MSATVCFGFTVQSTTNYGEMDGVHVTYMEVRESTTVKVSSSEDEDGDVLTKTANAVADLSDPSTLYGSPSIVGNTLFFGNPNFSAEAGKLDENDNVITSAFTDGRLSFGLQADEEMYFNRLTLEEFGAFSLTSPEGTENSGTLARVQAPAFLTIFDVLLDNGEIYTLPKATGIRLTEDMVATPSELTSAGGLHAASPILDEEGFPSSWEGVATFDISGSLREKGVFGPVGTTILGATYAEYDMNNILTVRANDGISTAFIDKKGITISPEMTPMTTPEPTTALLVLPCLFAMASITRKRTR